MSERYWVLRVKGRNRWEEGIYTGEEPLKAAATFSAAHGGVEVTIFQALPYQRVQVEGLNYAEQQIKAQAMAAEKYRQQVLGVSELQAGKPPEAPPPYEVVNGNPVYRPCGHRVLVEDGEFFKNYCPVCNKERVPGPPDPPRPPVRRDFG